MAAKKADITVVKSTDLERNLGKTITNNYYKYIDDFYTQNLSNKDSNFVIQSLEPMLEDLPALRGKLIDLYNRTFGTHPKVNDIPDDIKAIQGALLDGLVFAYDMEKQDVELYTMNAKLLYGMETNVEFIDDKVVDKNKVGEYKSFRIDVKYREGSNSFEFKAVNHRKKLNGDTIFIPYLTVLRGMKLIEHFLDNGNVLKLVQSVDGLEKTRVVTKSKHVLAEFCDDPTVSDYLQCQYFPLIASMYLPVVGAPSTTAMMTRVNLVRLDRVAKCKGMASLAKMGIYKPTNPVRTLIAENVAIQKLTRMQQESPEAYAKVISKLPKSRSAFDDVSNVSPIMVTKHLHQLSEADQEKAYGLIPGVLESTGRYSFLVEKNETVYKSGSGKSISKEEVQDLLRNNICKILSRSSDCKLSSTVGTNSAEYLSKIYGKDYFGKYESFNGRWAALFEELKLGRPFDMCCKDYCIDAGTLDKVLHYPEYSGKDVRRLLDADIEDVKSLYAKETGIRIRSSSYNPDSQVVLVRQCFATRNEDGAVSDYYKSVDVSQILQIWVLNN